jgi:hypothetical protein
MDSGLLRSQAMAQQKAAYDFDFSFCTSLENGRKKGKEDSRLGYTARFSYEDRGKRKKQRCDELLAAHHKSPECAW